jgi:hypothetical protein
MTKTAHKVTGRSSAELRVASDIFLVTVARITHEMAGPIQNVIIIGAGKKKKTSS